MIGTTEILSPEQVRGEEACIGTDVWQLGVMFFELLTGRMPFEASSTAEMYARILAAQFPPLQQLQPATPPALAKIVARCLEKEPSKRYASGSALYEALSNWEGSTGETVKVGRRQVAWLAGAAAALLLIGGGILAVRNPDGSTTDTKTDDKKTDDKKTRVLSSDAKDIEVDAADGVAEVYRNGKMVGTTPFHVRARTGEKDMPALTLAEDLNISVDFTIWNKQDLWEEKALRADAVVRVSPDRFVTLMNAEDERGHGAWMLHNLKRRLDGFATVQRWYPTGLNFIRAARAHQDAERCRQAGVPRTAPRSAGNTGPSCSISGTAEGRRPQTDQLLTVAR